MPTVNNWKHGRYDRQVKNLGWLLRHWKEVICFDVRIISKAVYDSTSGEFILTAYLCNDRVFTCTFQSGAVLRNWLNRPVFSGLPLWWINHETHTNAPSTLLWKKPVDPNRHVPINDTHRALWNPTLTDPCYHV